jgi:hypothetical protein
MSLAHTLEFNRQSKFIYQNKNKFASHLSFKDGTIININIIKLADLTT